MIRPYLENQLANRLEASKTTSKSSNTTPVQRLAMRRVLDVSGWKTLKNSMMKTQGLR
jgi:hypothetical protein